MKIESYITTIQYKSFEIGEKVRPDSSRCWIPPGIYTVTNFVVPRAYLSEKAGMLFLEGRVGACSGEHFVPYVAGDRYGVESFDIKKD